MKAISTNLEPFYPNNLLCFLEIFFIKFTLPAVVGQQ